MANKKSRFLKPFWYKISGHTDQEKHTKTIEEVSAAYDTIIRFKRAYIQCYKQAIGQMLPPIEHNKSIIEQLTKEIEELNQNIADTIDNTKKLVEAHKKGGVSDEEIEQMPDYKEWIDRKDRIQSMIEERNNWIEKRKQDNERFETDIEFHKQQLTRLFRGIDMIKTDQSEAIEHINYIRMQKGIAMTLSEISLDDTSQEKD